MIQGILANRITVRPTKKKIINTVSAMENGARYVQKKSVSGKKLLAGKAAEFLGGLKHKLKGV